VIPESISTFLKRHCYQCHGVETQEADLSLQNMAGTIHDTADAINWQDILDKLNNGEMPLKDEPQPSKDGLAKCRTDKLRTYICEPDGLNRRWLDKPADY